MTRRTRRSVAGSVLVVLGLVIGAVIATALQAEGRERSKADTNDGGAWLLKRDAGYVGHVNREVGEITAAVSVSDPGSDFDVDQAKGVIVVHDRTKGTVTVVDDSRRAGRQPGRRARSARTSQVHAVDGGALIVDDASMKAWKLTREQLLSVASTDERRPDRHRRGRARCRRRRPTATPCSSTRRRRQVVFLRPDGTTATSRHRRAHRPDGVGHDARRPTTAVFADTDGDVVRRLPRRRAAPLGIDVLGADGQPSALVLQQPGAGGRRRRRGDDRRHGRRRAARRRRREATDIGQLGGADPVAPIAYGGCVFAVSTTPATFTQWCADGTSGRGRHVEGDPAAAARRRRLRAAPAARQRLGLDQRRRHRRGVGDEPAAAPRPRRGLGQHPVPAQRRLRGRRHRPARAARSSPRSTRTTRTPRSCSPTRSTRSGPNQPPIARDDHGRDPRRPPDRRRRAGQRHRPERRRARRDARSSRRVATPQSPSPRTDAACRSSPAAGFAGTVTFGYTITDGRDASASANVTVEVAPVRRQRQPAARGPQRHRLDPPRPPDDVRRARPTTPTPTATPSCSTRSPSRTRAAPAGLIVPDPSGQVVFTPDPNTTPERIELTYTVSDDFGATAEGTVIVSVRLRGRQQRARRPQRRRRHRGRQADPPRRAGQRHRPRQRPAVRRPAADARAPDRPHDRLARRVADARRRAVLRPRRRRHLRLQLLGDRRRGDRRRPDPHRGRRAHREPAADRRSATTS